MKSCPDYGILMKVIGVVQITTQLRLNKTLVLKMSMQMSQIYNLLKDLTESSRKQNNDPINWKEIKSEVREFIWLCCFVHSTSFLFSLTTPWFPLPKLMNETNLLPFHLIWKHLVFNINSHIYSKTFLFPN